MTADVSSSDRIRIATIGGMACGVMVFGMRPAVSAAQNTVEGRVLSEQSTPVVGARVDLLSPATRTLRTDSAGRFVFTDVGNGPFRIQVRQVGFQPVDTSFAQVRGELTLRMQPLSTRLSRVLVRGRWQGIQGIVVDSQSLTPLSGAGIRVVGVSANARTDTLGTFAVEIRQPATYVIRVEHAGYASRVYSIIVRKDSATELLVSLAASSADDARNQILWREFDSRTRMRGLNSALVTADELASMGTETTSEALLRSRSFAMKNLRLQRDICLYVNGEPKPGWTMDAFEASEILAIEVYGRRGEVTNNLGVRWPKGVPCGPATGGSPIRLSESERRLLVQSVVIWLKQQ